MKKASKESYTKIGLDEKDIELLNQYFDAFSNLYGRIPLRSAFEIINEQNDNKFSEETLLKFAGLKSQEEQFYCIIRPEDYFDDIDESGPLDDEIVNEALFAVDDEDYYELCDAQFGKPICVLPKDKLLKFADDSYREETPKTLALEEFLEKNVKIMQPLAPADFTNTAKDLVDEFILDITINTGFESSEIEALLRLADLPEDGKEFEKLMSRLLPLAQDVRNNTRMWVNRGYTPKELAVLLSKA